MPLTSTFANGQTFSSSALAQTDFNSILQSLTLQILGIDPATDSLAYSKVRIAWQAQPGFTFTDDVVSIKTSERDDPYNRNRDRKYSTSSASTVLQTDTFSRTWEATWIFYGPNGFARAALLKSAFTLDFTNDALKASKLALVTDFPATIRAPEKRDGQWWERSDVRLRMYELVTETLTLPSVASVEIKVFSDRHNQVADITVP